MGDEKDMELPGFGAMNRLRTAGKKPVVLVVDDEPFMRQTLRQALEEFGFAVREAADGVAAVERVLQSPPDIVLLDVLMPKQDGYATCAELRRLPSGAHLPVVMVTSLEDPLSMHRAYEAGATDFIAKPLNHVLMCHRVLHALRASRAMQRLAKSEARLAEAQRITRLGNWEWNIKNDRLWWSDEVYRIFDLRPQGFERTYGAFLPAIHPEDRVMVDSAVRFSLKEKVPFDIEHRIVRPDGDWRAVHHLGDVSLDVSGQPVRMFGTMQDITERKRSEDRLRLLNEAIACLPIGITIADAEGRIVYTNPAEAQMHGYEAGELMHREARDFAPPELSQRMSLKELQGKGLWTRESVNVRKNGETFPVQLSSIAVRDASGAPLGMVTACEDISERKRREEHIRHLAYYDALTDLPNRVLFNDRLTYLLAQNQRHNRKAALFFLDLDRFKVINDSLGHSMGDRLLQEVARRLSEALRHTDVIARQGADESGHTVARFGGDEFTVWLTDIETVQVVVKVAQRILETFTRPFAVGSHEMFITPSIGIAFYPNDGQDVETLVKNADSAMYHAKGQGGNNYQFYSKSMNAAALNMLTMENALRKAMERDELLLHYQPQVDLDSGAIVGAEALLRWRRKGGEILSPGAFIPLAEESGLIVQIGEWVLRKVCMQSREWQDRGLPPLRVAVNLSSRQFWQKQLAETVSRLLQAFDLAPACLGLEITENILMQDEGSTIEALNALKGLGIQLSIDDFGIGYSSLNYLKRFPLDYLKIDRSFVRDIKDSRDDAAIVSAIIAMARSLKLKVVAEGVETEAQLSLLRDRGCNEIQGFLLSKPLPPEEFVQFLQRRGHLPDAILRSAVEKTHGVVPGA